MRGRVAGGRKRSSRCMGRSRHKSEGHANKFILIKEIRKECLSRGAAFGGMIEPLLAGLSGVAAPEGGASSKVPPSGVAFLPLGIRSPRERGSLAGIRMEESQWTLRRNAMSWSSNGSKRTL